jgi:hypothetical protein
VPVIIASPVEVTFVLALGILTAIQFQRVFDVAAVKGDRLSDGVK